MCTKRPTVFGNKMALFSKTGVSVVQYKASQKGLYFKNLQQNLFHRCQIVVFVFDKGPYKVAIFPLLNTYIMQYTHHMAAF
jgi:hypothetical protein